MSQRERILDLIKNRKNIPRSLINFIEITGEETISTGQHPTTYIEMKIRIKKKENQYIMKLKFIKKN